MNGPELARTLTRPRDSPSSGTHPPRSTLTAAGVGRRFRLSIRPVLSRVPPAGGA